MRHQTTAYDSLAIPQNQGKRREGPPRGITGSRARASSIGIAATKRSDDRLPLCVAPLVTPPR
jgi:hypothetical protein